MTNIFIHSIKDIMVGAFLKSYLYDCNILDLYYCSWLFAHSFGISLVSTKLHIFVLKYSRVERFPQPLMPVTQCIENNSASLLKTGKLCILHNCARLYE